MKVTSTTTLVTGSPLEPVHHKPGTPVDLPKSEAEDLISQGLAAPFQAPKESDAKAEPKEPKPAPKKKARSKKSED